MIMLTEDFPGSPGLSRKGFLQTSLLAGCGLLLLVPKSGMRPASTYHVSSAGDDHSSGSAIYPWKTITRVNAARLSPGDRVLFHSGETFPGQLYPRSSGDDSLDITYGSYGPGKRPIIDGSSSSALLLPTSASHHLRFDGLDFAGSTGEDMPTVRCYTHDVYFYDCVMRDSQQHNGFSAWSRTGAGIYNIILEACEASGNYAQGIFIGSETGENGPHHCLIQGCTAHHNGHELYHDHGIYAKFGVQVRENTCHINPAGAGIKVNCEGMRHSPYTPRVESNTVYGNMLGLYIVHEAAACINNLVYDNQRSNLELDDDTRNVTLMFNTLANTVAGKDSQAVNIAGAPQANRIRNNLLIQDQLTTPGRLYQAQGLSGLEDFARSNDLDYNIVYTDGSLSTAIFGDASGSLDWPTWQRLPGFPGQSSTFLTGLPDVVDRYTDLHPLEGGNLKGRGIACQVILDKDGHPRSFPPTPGCYE
jgi:hypothetical protein